MVNQRLDLGRVDIQELFANRPATTSGWVRWVTSDRVFGPIYDQTQPILMSIVREGRDQS